MRILEAGHDYALDSLDGGIEERITFVKREGPKFPFNVGHHPGTNMQEVVRVLIDRLEYLNRQKPCAETESCIGCAKSMLLLLELRAARRHQRFLDCRDVQELMHGPMCGNCGHVGCDGNCRSLPE